MATAEQLLHEAQYAFQNIGYEDSWEKRRNTAKAKSLAKKIIRKYPTSMEASEARAILRRLGDEAYETKPVAGQRHENRAVVNEDRGAAATTEDATVMFDWGGLLALITALPKAILTIVVIVAYLLFKDIWFLLLVPVLALLVFTRPFRRLLEPEQRQQMNIVVARVNEWMRKQRESDSGFL